MTTADIEPSDRLSARSVRLHALSMREEGAEWIVGRVDTGVFVALPEVGARVVRLLMDGMAPDAVKRTMEAELADDLDVEAFVRQLVRLGFVAELDDAPIAGAPIPRSSLARVRAHHVRWMLNPLLGIAAVLIVLAGLCLAVLNPGIVPGPADALWTSSGSLVMLSMLVTTWSVIFLHELGHLFTARAAGVPGRITLGTRLQFLCAQTDVSGIWASPRRTRMAVYLAGMAINAVLAAVALFLVYFSPSGGWHTVGSLLYVVQIPMLANQFLFFMRTDVYFVVQDVARCKNLYGDASVYFRYLTRKIMGKPVGDNPIIDFPARERLIIRLYAAFFVPSTIVCVAIFLALSLPILLGLLTGAVAGLVAMETPAAVLDGIVVISVLVTFRVVWARAWWRRHGPRVRSWARKVRGLS
ncbi:M50 family metallopeptidase [Streptosporangium sp. KLBMP 9127]|nr:hypothetical protein [Streptosporangium sp. KLBMP 9127]